LAAFGFGVTRLRRRKSRVGPQRTRSH
jgi:hypothetical protein